jgi:hypothetical protein
MKTPFEKLEKVEMKSASLDSTARRALHLATRASSGINSSFIASSEAKLLTR